MFQGSRPSADSTTPIRFDSRISLPSTASGEPPRKRSKFPAIRISCRRAYHDLNICRFWRRCAPAFDSLQHPLQRLEPVRLARRLVPSQPADPGKPHGESGLVPGRALQALECHLEHQALVGLVRHLAHRAEPFERVVADEAVDLMQLLIGETEI